MRMFSYYIDRGHSLNELINLTTDEKDFYIASMFYNIEKNTKEKVKIAQISNPFVYGLKE